MAEIVRIARRHGLLPLGRLDFSRDPASAATRTAQAEGLRAALEEAGGAFVKIGQLLSTRDDLLPVEWMSALSSLQREVEPADESEVLALLERELAAPVESVFRQFDTRPIAAASIAQVHRATLASGEIVAVKIQRPGIDEVVRRDVDIALRLIGLYSRSSALARALGVRDIAQQYGDDLVQQLDFRREARNLAALTAVEHEVRLPALVGDLSTPRVLVMEMLEGETITEAVRRAHRDDLSVAMRTVLRSLVRQIVFDGVFHADLHPGNVMILANGRPALVDFGSVGRLDRRLRDTVQELLLAYLAGDNDTVADALLSLAPLPPGADERAFRRDLSEVITDQLGAGAQISVETVDEILAVITPYGIAVPPALVSAGRAFAIFEGTLRSTVPDFDVLAEARSLAEEQIREQMQLGSLRERAATELLALVPVIRRLPKRLDRIGGAIESGRLNVNIRLIADASDRRLLRGLVRQLVLAGVGPVAGVVGLGYLTSAPVVGAALPAAAVGVVLVGVAVVLIGASLVDAVLSRRR